jgi:hypothetical protein
MLGGIAFQLFTISIFAMCSIEFYVRYSRNIPFHRSIDSSDASKEYRLPQGEVMSGKTTLMSVGLLFSTTCLFIRAIYRTIELSDGWNGRIISTQVLFNVLDGAMIVLALYTGNIAHPGLLLGSGSGLIKEPKEREASPSE